MQLDALTFAALALSLSPPAVAGDTALVPEFDVSQADGRLEIGVRLRNDGTDTVEVLTRRGSAPAPELEATLGDSHRALVFEPHPLSDRERMSRAGPRRHWAPLEANQTLVVGTYTFEWDGTLDTLDLALAVQTDAGVVAVEAALPLAPIRVAPQL